MAEARVEGSPILYSASQQIGPSRFEQLAGDGVVIDIKTTTGQYSSIDDWFRPVSKVEEGVVNRHLMTLQNQRNSEGKLTRPEEYQAEFDKDPQGYFRKLVIETPPDEWKLRLRESLDLLKEMQQLFTDPQKSERELKIGLDRIRSAGKNEIGGDASEAMAKYIEQTTAEKIGDIAFKKEVHSSVKALIQHQINIHLDLLKANSETRYKIEPGEFLTEEEQKNVLSPEAQAFVRRNFMQFMQTQDEGTDKRLAYLLMLRDQRKNSPAYVFDGRERHVYEAWLAGIEIVEKLETETDYKKRASLEKRLKDHKATVRKYTSQLTTTLEDRAELGPTGFQQVKNIAWDEVKNSINRLRQIDPSDPNKQLDNIEAPAPARKALINTSASYTSWEVQGMKDETYLQFGVTWNAYQRIRSLESTPTDKNDFISYSFPGQKDSRLLAATDVETEVRKLKEQFEAINTKISQLEEEITTKDELIAKLTADKTAIESQLTAAQTRLTTALTPGTATTEYDAANKIVDDLNLRLTKATSVLTTAINEKNNLENQINGLKKDREALAKKYDPYNPDPPITPITAGVTLTGNKTEVEIAKNIDDEKINRIKAYETARDAGKEAQYDRFKEKLKAYLQSTGYKDFYKHFNENEVKLIAQMNGLGTRKNSRTKLEVLDIGMGGTCGGPLKIKKYDIGYDKGREFRKKDASGKDLEADSKDIGFHFQGDFVFINPSTIPQFSGRLSPDAIEQILREPDRYREIKDIVQYIKDNDVIAIVTSFAVQNDLDGGSVEQDMIKSGRSLNVEAVQKIKERYGWNNIDVFRAWIDDPRIQKEIGIRPDEMIPRIVATRTKLHRWQRELLPEHTIVNITNTTGVASSNDREDPPMFFEFMIEQMMSKYGRLSTEDIDNLTFDQQLPTTGEMSYTVIQPNGVLETHFRNEVLTNDERAPKNELDLMYQSLMNQLILYESHSKYYNQARNYTGSKSENEIYRIGTFKRANIDLIQNKMNTLKTLYYPSPYGPVLTIEERMAKLIDFRENQMNHLTYELIDDNGKIIANRKNKELWNTFNANIHWHRKLKREQKNAEDRFVSTWLNKRAYRPNAYGISDIDLAEADYLFHKNNRLTYELEVYALGVDGLGMTKGMDATQATCVLADKFVDIDDDQHKRLRIKQFRALHGYDKAHGPNPKGLKMAVNRALGLLMTSVAMDNVRKIGMGLNEIAQANGVRLNIPVDQAMISLRPDQIEVLLDKKKDDEIVKRLTRRTAHEIKTSGQSSIWGIFDPDTEESIMPGVNSPGMSQDEVSKRLAKAWRTRRNDDFKDATARFFERHLLGTIFEDVKLGGYRISELINDVNETRMNDTATPETRPDGIVQENPFGKKGTRMSETDRQILALERLALGRKPINFSPPPGQVAISHAENNPTVIQQYYQSL